MNATEALETLASLSRSYKGTAEEHYHLAMCVQLLIDTLKETNKWTEPSNGEADA
jgi:hypothetical protein